MMREHGLGRAILCVARTFVWAVHCGVVGGLTGGVATCANERASSALPRLGFVFSRVCIAPTKGLLHVRTGTL